MYSIVLPPFRIQTDTRIRYVSFSILNFQRFYGQKNRWIDLNGIYHQLGVAEMKHDGWQIEITEDPTFSERLSKNYIFHLIRLSSKWIMAI